jgi:hypothetical protein
LARYCLNKRVDLIRVNPVLLHSHVGSNFIFPSVNPPQKNIIGNFGDWGEGTKNALFGE